MIKTSIVGSLKRLNWQKYMLPAAFFILLAVFVIYPTVTVFENSLKVNGVPDVGNYLKMFTHPSFFKILWQSSLVAILVAVLSTVLGLIVSVVVFKTTLPLRRLFSFATVVPLIVPGFVASLSFIYLFGRNGLITYQLLGLNLNIYNWISVAAVQVMDFTAMAFLLISAVLITIDSQVEDAARDLGASEWGVFRTITLPLLKPGIIAAIILVFMRSMSSFGTVIFLGGPFSTLASASYTQLIGAYNIEMAATFNAVLLIICVLAFWFYVKVQSENNRIRISSTGATIKSIDFARPVKIFTTVIVYAFTIFLLLILASVFLAAFTRYIGTDYSFTLDHMSRALQRGSAGILNTLYFASGTAIAVSLAGMVLAYIITRVEFKGRNLLDLLATMPFAMPGTFIGIGYILAFNQPPLLLTGTWIIVMAVTIIRQVPLGLRSGASVLSQQDRSIEDASASLGAGKVATFFRMILPMAGPAVLVTALYAFVSTVQTLGAIIFLITPGTKLLAVDVFEAVYKGEISTAAALSVIMLLLSAAGMAGIYLIQKRGKVAKWVQKILLQRPI